MSSGSLELIFAPRSIAVIGVSGEPGRSTAAQRFARALISFGFKGNLYPVHPSGGEIMGIKIYRSLRDIPGNIDLVVSIIPAQLTIGLVADCAAKGTKAIHLFTSGYSEIEDVKGKNLEAELLAAAKDSGIRIIGPNCMGIYNPKATLTFAADYPDQKGFPAESGQLGLISQSGGNASSSIREATTRGIFFSKVISYGNGADLNESDFLEYLMNDNDTKVIGIYAEGVKEGRRFLNVISEAAARKPVIVYKGGITEAGARACASHTSAIAGSATIWRYLLRQVGSIQVHNMHELVDVAVILLKMPKFKGKRVAIIGSGGGTGVSAADDCNNAGLVVPLLNNRIRKRLVKICGSEAGSIYRNPVDLSAFAPKETLMKAMICVINSNEIDLALIHFQFDAWAIGYRSEMIMPYTETIIELSKIISKPLVIVLHGQTTKIAKQMASTMEEKLVETGLPVFTSFSQAATAISRVLDYRGCSRA